MKHIIPALCIIILLWVLAMWVDKRPKLATKTIKADSSTLYVDSIIVGDTIMPVPDLMYLMVGYTAENATRQLTWSGATDFICTRMPTMLELVNDIRKINKSQDMHRIIVISMYRFADKDEYDKYYSRQPKYPKRTLKRKPVKRDPQYFFPRGFDMPNVPPDWEDKEWLKKT